LKEELSLHVGKRGCTGVHALTTKKKERDTGRREVKEPSNRGTTKKAKRGKKKCRFYTVWES